MQPIRVIIADDHAIFRDGLKMLFRKLKSDEIELVAEAEDGKELLDLVEVHKPDIVLTDIQMPIVNGIEAAKIIKQKYPDIGILALSTFNEEQMVIDMLDAGVKGYLLKNTNKEELLAAILKVHNGGVYYAPETTVHLTVKSGEVDYDQNNVRLMKQLTKKEIEVIKLVCESLSSKEIAVRLKLSRRTVESHREHIMEKINAKNAMDIMAFAIKNKIHKI